MSDKGGWPLTENGQVEAFLVVSCVIDCSARVSAGVGQPGDVNVQRPAVVHQVDTVRGIVDR